MLSSITARITAVLLAIMIIVISLSAVLNYYKFKATETNLLISRYAFVLNEIKATIETGLDLGLSLDLLPNVTVLLQDQVARDQSILSIDVFNRSGAVLFSTDSSFVDDLVSEEWVGAANENPDESWFIEERDSNAIGLAVLDNLGQITGYVAVRYSRSESTLALQDVAKKLAITASFIILASLVAGGFILHLLVRPWSQEVRKFSLIEDALRRDKIVDQEASNLSKQADEEITAKDNLDLVLSKIENIRSELRKLDSRS